MTTGQRILVNALASYGRTFFAMMLGLFSSRWVLQSLGNIDYGLMAVVGSLIGFISFLNSISSSACARFFALSIGRKDVDETNWWFNTALSIHIILPSVLVIIGRPIGEWAIDNFLSIPEERIATAHWVFRFSLVAAFFNMSATPFLAMYTAKQNIAELSIWGMATTLVNFCFVWWLTTYRGDAWLLYSLATVCISVCFCVAQALRAKYKYPECTVNIRRWFDKSKIGEVFSYAGWTIFGGMGWMMYNQGMSIVLNKFFPPIRFKSVNASYSVGSSLAGYTKTLSNALMNAFLPEIVASEGRGDRNAVHNQMFRASRLSFSIVAVCAVPLFFEADFILNLWLKTPPEFALIFCRTFLLCFLMTRLVGGFDAAICATGKIKWYQIIISSFLISSVFAAAIVIYLGGGVLGVCCVIFTFEMINTIGGVLFCHRIVGMPIMIWVKEILFRAFIVISMCSILFLLTQGLGCEDSLTKHLANCILFFAFTGVLCWMIMIKKDERQQLLNSISKLTKFFKIKS